MADNVTGIVLDIPPTVLQNIKNADKAIKDLEQTSKKAAQNIKKDFDTTMVSGVEAFIKKVQEAQTKLGGLKMPTIDASGLSSAIQALSQAMATIDKSATTGANRLTRIANAMTALQGANPNPQLFQNIADGITKIGNTSQQTIQNVSQLALVMAQLAKDIRTVQQAQNAQNANTATAAQYNKLYKEQADLVRRINEIKSKGADADGRDLTLLDRMRERYDEINKQLDKLNRKKQTAASDLARTQGYNRVGDAQARTDAMGAINYAKQAKSLKDLQDAYKNLKAVMATTNPDSSAWRQMNSVLGQTRTRIDEIKKSMGEFKSHASQVGDVAGQLKRTLAATFSISAITGYINKLIETRAQFELQQTALRAILQDKQEADKIFQQVQQMALQSPFSIMQMTTFTKQLAAYRIESEKLVGTTKMLADVSAGLGVDMGRLILAYGQVKAANYLRATEVRQFTEAGLNIAGELANYFSELQGKMISVGDVMEMITKRMVRFEDVEEVFKRVTSAGGLFYDMQKKQSDTLWGQLQRIKDAMSIMFNEIGKSNQGTISWMLKAIRELINSWRTLAPIINIAGAALVAYMVAGKAIPSMIAGLKAVRASWIAVTAATKAADAAGKAAAASNPYGILATAAAALLMTIYQLATAQSALNEEFDRISEEFSKDMWDLIFKFQEGADAVRDTTKSYDERKKALEDLQNTFRGILPDQDLEYENILKITDGYKSATEAIKAYSAEKAKQAATEAINTEKQNRYNELIDEAKDLAFHVQNAFDSLASANIASIKGEIGNVMVAIQEEVNKGMITSATEASNRFMEIMEKRFGDMNKSAYAKGLKRGLNTLFGTGSFLDQKLFGDDFSDYLTFVADAQREFNAQMRVWNDGLNSEMQLEFEREKDNYERRIKIMQKFQAALIMLQKARQEGHINDKGEAVDEEGKINVADLEKATETVKKFLPEADKIKVQWDNIVDATNNETDALIYFDGIQKKVLDSYLQNLIKTSKNTAIVNWAEETSQKLKASGFQEMQIDIANTAKRWGLLSGVSSAVMNKLRIDANTNYTSAAKDAKALSDEAQQNILKINQTATSLIAMGLAANKAQAMAMAEKQWGTTIAQEQKTVDWASELAKLWGQIDKSTSKVNKNSSSQKDIWTPRLNLMQKVNKEYEKLLKYYSKEEAMARIRTSYGDAVAEAFKGTQWADISKWGTFDAQATVDRLKKLAEKAGRGAKKKILEAVGTLQAEIDIKIEEKNIQEAKDKIQSLFDNYELTKTLGGLGLNIDLTYLVGGRPVKLEDVRRQLEAELSTVKATGGEEDTVKAYEDALKKVTDLENKNAIERLKNYNKYLLESMSERVQIELKAQQEISKIRQDATLDDFSKEQAINNVRKKMQEDLTKYDFDQFKGSDVYLQTFKDLERASKTQLQYVIDKLKELQAVNKDLSPLQVKSIAQEIKKAEDALGSQAAITSVFSNLKKSIQYAKERNNLLDKQVLLQKQVEDQESVQNREQKILNDLTLKRDAIQDKSSQQWKDANDAVEKQRLHLVAIQNIIEKYKKDLKGVTGQISAGEAAWNNFRGAMGKVNDSLGAISEAIGSISEGLDSMGLMTDSMRDGFESASEILGGLSKMMQGLESIDITKPFSIISGVGRTIGGLFSTIGGFFGIGDKKKERQIKRLQEKVENLQKAYEKLQTAIEEAYAYDDYKAGYNQSLKNLEEQKKAIQEQINLEDSKKKKDKEKLKEWNEALENITEKEKGLRDQFYEDWGSYSEKSLQNAGEEWVSTWLDAFKETGDGLDALKEKWDEFYQNMILKQAASAVVNKKLKKHIEAINSVLDTEGLSEMETSQRIKEIIEQAKGEAGTINQMLKEWFEALGIKGGQGDLLLSDLQKGIQNITEPQAAAIEAYLNSMRFAVFEQNNILTEMLSAIQAQYGANDNSPMLQEVRAIRSLVASIDDRLSRVIVQRSSASSNYMVKVG